MNSLKEWSEEGLNISSLSGPVTGCAAVPSHYSEGKRDATPWWLAEGFAFDSAEPLPSIFRPKVEAGDTEPRSARPDLAGSASPKARLSGSRISNRTASYIIASFLLVFAAADGIILTASSVSADRRAAIYAAPAALNQDSAEIATLYSVSAPGGAEDSQASSFAPVRTSLHGGQSWTAAVSTLEHLVTQQRASLASAAKHPENSPLPGGLEAWVNAKERKQAGLAEACTASPAQCWKGATQIR